MLIGKLITRNLLLTLELGTCRALVKLQGEALEKSAKRADRLAGELADTRRELRDAVAEIETTTKHHTTERNQWAARVNELTAEVDSRSAERDGLRRSLEASTTRERLLTRERDHWKAAARNAGANVEGELDALVASS